MPWCPVCKNEYREGFTTCAECKVPLVASYEDIPVAIYFGGEREVAAMVEFLKKNDFEEAYMAYDEAENVYELFVKKDNEKSAKRMLKDYLDNMETNHLDFSDLGLMDDGSECEDEDDEDDEMSDEEIDIMMEEVDSSLDESDSQKQTAKKGTAYKNADDNSENDEVSIHEEIPQFQQEQEEKKPVATVYQDKHEKAEEYKSSASALMMVGVLGIVLIVVNELGVLPFNLNFNKPMFYGVMGSVFVLFIIFAIYSMSQYKKILKQADAEDDIVKQMKDLLNAQFSKEQILSEENSDGKNDEQLYFVRTAKMKSQLTKEFAGADEALIEKMVDDHYDEIFS